MKSVLSIVCIAFLAILTYGLIQGSNLQNHHKYNCQTLYISENIDLETAYKSIEGKDTSGLKKRARQLGASKEFVDPLSDIELKVFIIQTSISDEHILFEELEEEIKMREEERYNSRNIDDPQLSSQDQLDLQDSTITTEELQSLQGLQSLQSLQDLQEDFSG